MTELEPEELLADFAVACRGGELPPAVREKAVHCLVDAMTLAVEAADHPVVRAVAGTIAPAGPGAGTARTWVGGPRAAVSDAILLDAVASHAFFQDDTDMAAWAHPGSLVPAVALGLAEARGAGLEVALRGLVAGYATLNWLGAREDVARRVVEAGFRASPVFGPIAAAVAASVVLGLDAARTRHAVAIAADTTGGTLEPVRSGAQNWRLQNGFAAQRGAVAALLAEAGVGGSPRPLSGPAGFLACFAGGVMPSGWRRPPRVEAILEVWFKPYPTLGDNMAPVVAAARLHAHMPDPAEVRRIEIRMNDHFAAYPGTRYRGPFERTEQMITSTAFAVSTLLRHGDLHYGDYARLIDDAAVLALVEKVVVVPVAGMDHLDGEVEVFTATGSIAARAAEAPRTVFFRDRAATRDIVAARLFAGSDLDRVLFAVADGDGPAPGFDDLFAELAAPPRGGRTPPQSGG